MDFFKISVKETKGEPPSLYPDFIVGRTKDLMVQGKHFYAIWDEQQNLWSTDEYDVQRLVDEKISGYAKYLKETTGEEFQIKSLASASSGGWYQFRKYVQNLSDNAHPLDDNLTFQNTEVKKSDYVSKRLPYALESGDYSAWDELVGTLYAVDERAKIEWMIGAVVSGDAKRIQKFGVLYGPAGTGKSTVLNIIMKLFDGYTTTFDAKALGSANKDFATEAFKGNPLVAIQQDGDLSRIEDNTRLNSVTAHEPMTFNEKYKPGYTGRVNAFCFMGTNQPVKITDSKSGLIRRLIDVHPTGVKIPENHYNTLVSKIDFELGAVAHHCLDIYRTMGRNYYSSYRPLEMMLQTDIFFNFIEAHFDIFKAQDATSLKQAYAMYKEWCSETGIEKPLQQYKMREELRQYFDEFRERGTIDGHSVRNYYSGFNANKFKIPAEEANTFSLVIEDTASLIDERYAGLSAQYEIFDEEMGIDRPKNKWAKVKTTLRDVDTTKVHYVQIPENDIVIDFDLKDENGEKSLEANLQAASVWPATYAELSKSGSGVHLHYEYTGDVAELAAVYSEGIEIKTLLGGAGLRRRLTKCNNVPVASISGGLPLREKKVQTDQTIKSEKGLRSLIQRALQKDIDTLPGTKTNIDFIKHVLDEAWDSGMAYDLTDMRGHIMAFAANSSNQSLYCLKLVTQMKFASENTQSFDTFGEDPIPTEVAKDERLVFFDVEVFPNLFVICWKFAGDTDVVRMINPTAAQVEELLKLRLVGFNVRRYDNHILWGALLGCSNKQLFELSQRIINNERSGMYGEAYNVSYVDIYEMASEKMSLAMWGIRLGLHKLEQNLPWDEDVPEDKWESIVDYCVGDVHLTEAVFEDRKQDFVARQILAELSGLSINDTTQKHTAKIIFGSDRDASSKFVHEDLRGMFPGYEFDRGKSMYRGEDPSEGGYVYSEPGMYENVAVYDVASMHPYSIINMNYFGPYTPNFRAIVEARIAIKRKDFETAKQMFNGRLVPYLNDEAGASQLAYALKIAINIVYGMTSAKFDNPFRNHENVDNVVAKRGALFMIDLKNYVQQELGAQVVHIKTDSIKVPNATPEIRDAIFNFGAKYGYEFESENVYDKFCLVNDAVYIAQELGQWTATGAQFAHPYVFKSLFSQEVIEFDDLCETKQVMAGTMFLDLEYDRPAALSGSTDNMQYIGRVGRFVPVKENTGGGILYRVKDDKLFAVTGTKGYLWMEATNAINKGLDIIDMSYFEKLADDAAKAIWKHGNFDGFIK